MSISDPRHCGQPIPENWLQDPHLTSYSPSIYGQQTHTIGFYPSAPPFPPPPPPYSPPSTPYAIPPTPYSLPPTPYSLPPTPYSLPPTPYSLPPTPYSLPPTPYSQPPFGYQESQHPGNANLNQQQQYNPSYVGSSTTPFRPAPPVVPQSQYPPLSEHDGTSPNDYGNKNTEHALGFTNITNELSLYPSLQGSETLRNRNHTETPLPDNLTLLWESCKAAKLYFVQQEGHIVSPGEPLKFRAYKFPTNVQSTGQRVGRLSGHAKGATLLVTMENAWRLGLNRDRSYLVKGSCGEIAFYDTSTSPARYAIVIFPKEVTKEDWQRLQVLLQASSLMVDEPSNVVDKFESGVESVFDSFTQGVDSIVKKGIPTTVHKNTKWLRKGTGNLVRIGGGIVSKGVHLVTDSIVVKEEPKDSCQQHKHLFEALKNVRQAIEKKTVTTVLPL